MNPIPSVKNLTIRLLAALLLALAALSVPLQGALAGEIMVTNGNNDGAGSLRQAILDAHAGDTILFDDSYSINLSPQLYIDKDLTIDGEANEVALSGGGAERVLEVAGGVTVNLNHLTITGGSAERGGGIYNAGTLHLTEVVVTKSSAVWGGGVYNAGTITLDATTVSANTASTDGAGLYNAPGSLMTIQNGSLVGGLGEGNSATGGAAAGGIFNYNATLNIDASTVSYNTSANSAGGIMMHGGTLNITNASISENTAAAYGGGLAVSSYASTTTIQTSQITNNDAANGGGIYADSTLSITNGSLSGNTASQNGGGVYTSYDATLDHNTVSSNTAVGYGGGVWNDAKLVIQNSATIGPSNSAGYGGGVYNADSLTLSASTVVGNSATTNTGGGVYTDTTGTTSVAASSIRSNTALSGGGLYNDSGGATTLDASTVQANLASYGGGIFNGGILVVQNASLVTANTATYGGGIHNGGGNNNYDGTTTVDASTISANTASSLGGGIWSKGNLTIQNGSLIGGTGAGNSATDSGGGIYNNSGPTTVSHSTVQANSANYGGGMLNNGALNISNSTLAGNHANEDGGGIHNGGTQTTTGSTFSGNSASHGGGEINTGTAVIANSTFSGNSSTSWGATTGGGFNNYYGVTYLTNTTFSGNSSPSFGAAIFTAGGNVILKNSLVAGNAGGNCESVGTPFITDGGGNLVWGDTSCPGLNADPLLSPLADHGGSTWDFALLPGSAAIDAGEDAICAAAVGGPNYGAGGVDQRGATRPQGAHCDIGAFESHGFHLQIFAGTGQSAPAATTFTTPLWVSISALQAGEPVADGRVTYTPPGSGASASLSSTMAAIVYQPNYLEGLAHVSATANDITGSYNVHASASGSGAGVDFALQNTCGNNLTVTNANDTGTGSLRQAMTSLCAGGTITFAGDYTIHPASPLTIDKNMTINGSGHKVRVSGDADNDGDGDGAVFIVNTGVSASLSNLSIEKGKAEYGGGIYNNGTLTLTNSTILDNTAVYGGGIFNNGALDMLNCTLTGNGAEYGGGIYNMTSAGATLVTNSTIVGNGASASGGNLDATSRLELGNTIVANSISGVNCAGTFADSGGNLVWGDATCPGVNANPLLGPLADNGGSTWTFALLAGSGAFDAGLDGLCPAADQRGASRPENAHCDIGAYEVADITPPTVLSSRRASGDPSSAASVDFTLTFSESVTGVDPLDFSLTADGVTGAGVTGVSGADASYTVTVNTGSGNGTLRLDVLAGASIKDLAENPFGAAYTGGEFYSITKTAPVLLAPADGADLHYNFPTFDWSNYPAAIGYQIQISKNNTFTQIVKSLTLSGGSNSTYTSTSALSANTDHFWRVRAKLTSTTFSVWSVVFSLHSGNPPSAPVLVSPAANALSTDYTPLFDWANSSLPTGTTFDHYQIQASPDAGFGTLSIDATTTIGDISASTYTPGIDLAANTTYFWHVRAFNAAGDYSAWSAVRSLRVAMTSPTLSSPGDNGWTYSRRPLLDWGDVPGATGYSIQVSRYDTFTPLLITYTVSTATSQYTPTSDLPASSLLYWRVKATGPNGPSLHSGFRSFHTGNPPSVPTLVTPANNALTTDTTPLFDWANASVPTGVGFAQYEIQIADNPGFDPVEINGLTPWNDITASFYTPLTNLTGGTTYYWRVRSWAPAGEASFGDRSAWSLVRSLRIAFPAPALLEPCLETFLNGNTHTRRPFFDWNDIPGAAGYSVQISRYNSFTPLVITYTLSTPTSQYTPTGDLPAGTTLYWRVRANGPYGPGQYPSACSFTTGNPPSVPSLLLPALNALTLDYTPRLDWGTSTVPTGTTFNHYQLWVDDDPAFGSPAVDEDVPGLANHEYTLPDLDALPSNTKHYWKVRSWNDAGDWSAWSAVRYFRTAIAPAALLDPTAGELAGGLKPVFDWEDAGGATGYTFQVSRNNTFTQMVLNKTTVESTYTPTANLPTGITLYWRVRANGPNGPSAWSTVETFQTP